MPQMPVGQLVGHKGGQLVVLETSSHLTRIEVIRGQAAVQLQVIVDIQSQATETAHHPGRGSSYMEGVNQINPSRKIETLQYISQLVINIRILHFAALAYAGHSEYSDKAQNNQGRAYHNEPNEQDTIPNIQLLKGHENRC